MKLAIVVLAGAETHEGLGRVVNALEAVKEAKDAKDDVKLIFDGAGTAWIGVLAKSDHRAHGLYEAVRDQITGACKFCAGAFGQTDAVNASGVAFIDEYDGHPSFRQLLAEGYQVLNF